MTPTLDHLRQILASGAETPLGRIITRRHYALRHVPVGTPSLIVVLRGIKTIGLHGREWQVRAGDWLALSADLAVDVVNQPEHGLYHALAIAFNASDLDAVRPLVPIPEHAAPPVQPDVQVSDEMWRTLLHYAETAADAPEAVRTHRRREVLLAMLAEGQAQNLLVSPADRITTRVTHWLASQPSRRWRVAEIASKLAMSEPTLRRRLAAEGTQFRDLLREVRLATALALLQQGNVSVAQAAEWVGYDSPSRFAQRFRERFGESPSHVATRPE